MHKCLNLSLTRLDLHCNTSQQINGIRNLKTANIFPATPCLLKQLQIDSPGFAIARYQELQNKQDCTPVEPRLRPYQNCAVNFILNSKNHGLAIFDEQRLGKTPTVLTALKIRKAKAIIIAPKSLIYQWYEEYTKWYDNNVLVIDGDKNTRTKLYMASEHSIILSYNTAMADQETIIKYNHFDHIVVDEAHRLRNIKKSRKYKPEIAKAVISISKLIPYKLALSGTPSPNTADDIFGILHFLYPDIFSSYYAFCDYYFKQETQYAKINGIPTQLQKCTGEFKTKIKEQEMLEFLETISIQRKRKEVMQWLPKYNITKMSLPMDRAQQNAYETLSKYYEYNTHVYLDALSIMLAQRQLAMAPELLDCDSIGCKFEFINQYIKDYPEKSIIIVSTLLEPLKLLSKNLPIMHYHFLTGETTPKSRNNIKKLFQDKKCKLILANLNVIKEGFTLDIADTIIFLDSSFTYTDNIQCMDRLVPTAENRVHSNTQDIILLLAKDTIDEYIYEMVYEKKASSADIINNYKENIERSKQ